MTFEVEQIEGGNNRTTHIRFATGFLSTACIKEYAHIRTEDGNFLKKGSSYLITKVKLTARPPAEFIWRLNEGRRDDYTTLFQKLINDIAPGALGKHIYIVKFVVKEI